MREFDAFQDVPKIARKADKTIREKLIAAERGREFYDGDRRNGYGGFTNDGRWGPVADRLIKVYGLTPESSVLQINCHKGFLVEEFLKRGLTARGTEVSEYALGCASNDVRPHLRYSKTMWDVPFGGTYDLVLAASPVYAGSIGDALKVLAQVKRLAKNAWITLAAYETEADYWLLRRWFTLGTTILKKEEWLELLQYAGYEWDYRFDTAQSLNLE